jgi:DNA-directed RNA polymerase specialized sigma24 family protein
MRSEWEDLRESFARFIRGKEGQRAFEKLRWRSLTVVRFADGRALVDYLAHVGGDLDEKDRILGELAAAMWHGPTGTIATALLVLGLWPGLDAAFRRRVCLWRDRPSELAADMLYTVFVQARHLDRSRIHRVAATLVRSTERDVVRRRLREHRRQRLISKRPIDMVEDVAAKSRAEAEEDPPPKPAALELAAMVEGRTPAQAIEEMRRWLRGLIARDADIVVDAVLLKRSGDDLAAEWGISRDTVYKRVERALLRVRALLRIRSRKERNFSVRRSAKVAFARP